MAQKPISHVVPRADPWGGNTSENAGFLPSSELLTPVGSSLSHETGIRTLNGSKTIQLNRRCTAPTPPDAEEDDRGAEGSLHNRKKKKKKDTQRLETK